MKISFRLLKKARKYWKYLLLSMLAIVGITGAQLYAPWVVRELTRLATTGDAQIADHALRMGLTLLAVYALQAVCAFVRSYFTHYAAWRFVADLRKEIYDKLQQLSLKYYHDKQTGQLMSRIINDTNDIELLVAHAAPDLIINVLIFGSVAGVLFYINAPLAAVCLFTIPLLVISSFYYSKRVRPKFRRRQQTIGQLNGTLQDNLTGIKEIQVFNQQQTESARVGKLAREYSDQTIYALRIGAIYHPFIQFITFIGTVLVIIVGGYFASGGMIPIEDIVAFVLYMGIFYAPITTLARINEDVNTALAGSERVFEVLDAEPDVTEAPDAVEMGRAKGAIRFSHVNFHYKENMEVLKDIDLLINPGEIVALVGPTGVGKTTLISLIARFYDPVSGVLHLDDVDIRTLTLNSLRENMSIVLQDVFLFNGTVGENIAYGQKEATPEQIAAAAKTARAHEFIESFENGYDTMIGERGVRLSGGQKQRISIARAVLRNSPILILDEATASVDVETEKLIHEAMDEVMRNRTTIIIAHRLSTVKRADKIVVLNEGKIEEMGTHNQLLEKDGVYAHLAKIQISGF
ncbi:MAG: ABC transporter ATP-binding protein/permease [Defluviitaleaceae bacterium]|nr:ABC transporter ATP-binding protein/permease [Defluviitaleaceae bacterium]